MHADLASTVAQPAPVWPCRRQRLAVQTKGALAVPLGPVHELAAPAAPHATGFNGTHGNRAWVNVVAASGFGTGSCRRALPALERGRVPALLTRWREAPRPVRRSARVVATAGFIVPISLIADS